MADPPDAAADTQGTRGVLYPAKLPTFVRIPPPAGVAAFVRWFWIPEWDLPMGRTSRQHVIAFPASNLVVEESSVEFVGPTTRASHRDLTGTGWAVGALLRPAAVPAFTDDPGGIRDAATEVEASVLHEAIRAAMESSVDGRHGRAVAVFGDWLADRVPAPSEEAMTANALADLIDTDPTVLLVGDVAARLGVSVRTAQRMCRRYVGLTPAAMIRRRRLQEAAEALRADPDMNLADLAARSGYADHAHLTRDFRTVLGFTPSKYRRFQNP